MMRFPRTRPTLADKLETCATTEDLGAMVKALSGRDYTLTDEERAAAARRRVLLARSGL